MFEWKEFEKARHIFSHAGSSAYVEAWGQHNIEIRPTDLLRWIELVKEDLGYLTLVDIVAIHKNDNYTYEIIYHLLSMENHQRLNLHLHFNEGEMIPSISSFYPNSEWMEREQFKRLGIPHSIPSSAKEWSQDFPLELPPIKYNPNKSETPYPEEAYKWERFGILSPETLGLFEWAICFDPVNIVESKVRTGFHHQGLEKLLQTKEWIQSLHLVDKLQPGIAPTYSLVLVKNMEEMLRIKLPERAQAIRIVLLEMARIAEHLTVMAEMTMASGQNEFKIFINAREKIYELFEKYCGQRQGFSVARLGGIKEDLPHGWIVEYQSVSDVLLKNLLTVHRSLVSQKKFRSLLQVAPVKAQTILQWGVSGPVMRASGLNFDLRKSQPFYFYQDIDFDIPIGIHGTAYDRYLVRYEEIFQSLRIITQVIDNLPLGEIINPLYDKPYHELKDYLLSEPRVNGWHYSSVESPNGEAGFFHLMDNQMNTSRIKVKTPSFSVAQAIPHLMRGLNKQQIPASLASLGMRRFEMDR